MNTKAPIAIHPPEDFEPMRKAGRITAECLDMITEHVAPGITTERLDSLCHEFLLLKGATPAPLGYRGYPRSICTSVNHVVCHGIPCPRPLREGDILNIDVTAKYQGWHGDSSRMFHVGKISLRARKLIEITYDALEKAIEKVRPGANFGDIGKSIQPFAERRGFSVVRDFCGHGIGMGFHEPPEVVHFQRTFIPDKQTEMKPGMFFTIEPMINAGKSAVTLQKDGWTVVTKDRCLSAQFEHTVAVTQDGCEVFTRSLKGYTRPPYDWE